ncbi:unnamed protein product [Spirodela intermedia]|uniref:Uncharacterized protein n=2 Tax=Spirodela intermedia TaxID=51605 RepID=A0A7I8KI86_SPIIN|nr:unnamed protein product [Spirodela intermedia]CAA6660790.1 unnamed protein product [Spirodela intermedia]CAA7397142.1 unnamed protein product [Spirodela intermedia]
MEMFNDFIFRTALIEPPTFGEVRTWCNERQGGTRIYERIDRCFTNNITLMSDHTPILILPNSRASSPRPLFRFQNMWTQHESF